MHVLTLVQISAAAILPIGVLVTQKSDGSIEPNVPPVLSEPDASIEQLIQPELLVTELRVSMSPPENISIARVEKRVISAAAPPKSPMLPDGLERSWDRIIEESQDSSLNLTMARSAAADVPTSVNPRLATVSELPASQETSTVADSVAASVPSTDPQMVNSTASSSLSPQINHQASEPAGISLASAISTSEQLDPRPQTPQQADTGATYSLGIDEQLQESLFKKSEQSGDYQVLADSSLHFSTGENIAISELMLQQASE